MTQHSQTVSIPDEYLLPNMEVEFFMWLHSMNLMPDAAYRVYKAYCDKTGRAVSRSDIDDLCGKDYNVS